MKPRDRFQQLSKQAVNNPSLQIALDNNASRRRKGWEKAYSSLPNPDATRKKAREIRQDVIENLGAYLDQFMGQVITNGILVHWAENASQASQMVVEITQRHAANLVVKSKSMVTEEINLNSALESAGILVVETDLGEYIVQLRGERPTHIISPAVHLRKEDVAETFEKHLNMPYTTDITTMNAAARRKLRDDFLTAKVGISGVNFGVAETGTLCLVTNEGNGRMVTTVPQVHIAVMGAERLVPTLDDLATILQVLPRSATGQKMTSYLNWINKPRQNGDPDGPNERHLVVVDNGRLAQRRTQFSEALACIRCGACLNACPVYQEVGGRTYNSVYPGPIGALVSPALFGIQNHGHLSKASTLCGACKDACPVGIDIPLLLQRTRVQFVDKVSQPQFISLGMRLYAWTASSPARYKRAQKAVFWLMRLLPRKAGWVRWMPLQLSAWTRKRHFPSFARKPFREHWGKTKPVRVVGLSSVEEQEEEMIAPRMPRSSQEDLSGRFEEELHLVGGEFVRIKAEKLAAEVTSHFQNMEVHAVIAWETEMIGSEEIRLHSEAVGIDWLSPTLSNDVSRRIQEVTRIGKVQAGITGAIAAIADTGTLVLTSGVGKSQMASLLPRIHVVVLSSKDIYATMSEWLSIAGKRVMANTSCIAFVTGPSRTADIEMTLTTGVHGPAKVIVFCVE
ncbi:MAG: iron-sulfur cluster-binding protein [Chloroflexi bacterium]|nr:iron-sulfur cluster-binding protein [Chloroflexota bacterium]